MKLAINFLGTWQRWAIDSGAVAETEARVLNYKSADGTEQGGAKEIDVLCRAGRPREEGNWIALGEKSYRLCLLGKLGIYVDEPSPLLTFR